MIDDPVLVNDWHPVAHASQLETTPVLPARLLGEDLVLWRAGEQVLAWRDLCVHRGTRLSLGRVANDTLVCPYHGWTYAPDGRCVHIPAHPEQTPPARARATVYRSDCDQLVAAARSQLPAAGFMERWSAGERAPLADLIRMMLARL